MHRFANNVRMTRVVSPLNVTRDDVPEEVRQHHDHQEPFVPVIGEAPMHAVELMTWSWPPFFVNRIVMEHTQMFVHVSNVTKQSSAQNHSRLCRPHLTVLLCHQWTTSSSPPEDFARSRALVPVGDSDKARRCVLAH
jgi:hypothetical protein